MRECIRQVCRADVPHLAPDVRVPVARTGRRPEVQADMAGGTERARPERRAGAGGFAPICCAGVATQPGRVREAVPGDRLPRPVPGIRRSRSLGAVGQGHRRLAVVASGDRCRGDGDRGPQLAIDDRIGAARPVELRLSGRLPACRRRRVAGHPAGTPATAEIASGIARNPRAVAGGDPRSDGRSRLAAASVIRAFTVVFLTVFHRGRLRKRLIYRVKPARLSAVERGTWWLRVTLRCAAPVGGAGCGPHGCVVSGAPRADDGDAATTPRRKLRARARCSTPGWASKKWRGFGGGSRSAFACDSAGIPAGGVL